MRRSARTRRRSARHQEKQTFLKVIYENFYKVYNPKAADRLGVVYTPNEIVRFMVEGADWLCHKHFGRTLIDRDVEILDPATGTGTFICELIEHFRGQPEKLAHKYREELHANEVAILPYYVANLNIEATYAAVAGGYEEFKNLCFVDTLDNVAGLGIKAGHQGDLFAALSDENVERVKRQNKRKISVVIGNPPYNANQQNENDNNKNRAYPHIDGLIKRSFVQALDRAEDQGLRHVCAVLPLGGGPAARRRGDRLRHQPQLHRQPDLRRVPALCGARSSPRSIWSTSAATCGRTRGSRGPSTTSSASRPGWRSRSS